ncbi:hypothetical protein DAEQUDRAFT_730758 [Daedalea quercina L-15889]|uniref:MYND-type domain-containing protein n=1 Tax=Daedalea quercina L-15889 TaxID=1314783 RepID=A0A165MQL2_9APHY|nr:hypothetical protein DAEQUDRAFT_730758 [Daedalea quercina L-15889]
MPLIDQLAQFLAESGGVPPPAPRVPHEASDPEETLRKGNTQCQHCFKSRLDGVRMSRCGACRVDMYCSKECQKAAWPVHKTRCKINQRVNEQVGIDIEQHYKALRNFCQKHRPVLSDSVIRALDLCVDPSRAETDLLTIVVCPRPGSTRPETDFYATAASVTPLDDFEPAKQDEMQSQLKYASELCKREGGMGAVFVVVCCVDPIIMNVIPVGFSQECLDDIQPGEPWKERLFSRMNEGIVV